MAGLSKTQIDKLGERIRDADVLSSEELTLLQQVRAAHDDALREVADRLADELGLQPASRLKTVGTIVDKLRREKMRLTQMQDIAGVRIVADMDRIDQDAMVERICALFPDAKVVDRRAAPSHGYRAVHVIVSTAGRLVEVQVRTELQHLWAQAMERIADNFGRGLRYGDTTDVFPAEVISEIVPAFLFLAELIAFSESQQESVRVLQSRAEDFFGVGREPPLFRSIQERTLATNRELLGACRGVLTAMTARQSSS